MRTILSITRLRRGCSVTLFRPGGACGNSGLYTRRRRDQGERGEEQVSSLANDREGRERLYGLRLRYRAKLFSRFELGVLSNQFFGRALGRLFFRTWHLARRHKNSY